MKYTEEKINEIEQNILSGMDKEIREEEEYEEIALHIAHNTINKLYEYKFNDKVYSWYCETDVQDTLGKGCVCYCWDIDKLNIVGPNKYKPASSFCLYSKKNPDPIVASAIAIIAMLRHICGKDIKIEELDSDEES